VTAALPKVQRAHTDLEVVAVVVGEDLESKERYSSKLRGIPSRTDLDYLLGEWSVPGTPFLVGIGENGKILNRGIANNLPQVEHFSDELIARNREATEEPEESPGRTLEIGKLNGSRIRVPAND
jgi:hypothetical protein